MPSKNYICDALHELMRLQIRPKKIRRTCYGVSEQQIDKGKQMVCIYTDLNIAFDSVSMDVLVANRDRLELPFSLLLWLRSYLINRDRAL